MNNDTDIRAEKIDAAVEAAGELITALDKEGPLSGGQIRLLIEASVRSAVPNFQSFEIKNSAQRIYNDMKAVTHED